MLSLVVNVYSFKGKVEECENAYLLAVQKKLKDYEDLEEQGRLLKLPCIWQEWRVCREVFTSGN